MDNEQSVLIKTVHQRNLLASYRDSKYENLINRLNTQAGQILKDDMGSQFVGNCARDLAGEVVRNFFNTSDYYITVDQLAERILKFTYEEDYDPLKNNGSIENIRKTVYNYGDMTSSALSEITDELDLNQRKLFEKEEVWNEQKQQYEKKYIDRNLIKKSKENYVESIRNTDGSITDEYTERKGEYITYINGVVSRRQEVDHIQAVATAKYNAKYISNSGVEALKRFYNSPDNFAMMDKIANGSKGDVEVFEKDGRTLTPQNVREEKQNIKQELKNLLGEEPSNSKINEEFARRTKNITHRASPEEYAEAICDRWENAKDEQTRIELCDKGYLNEEGKVPKYLKYKLINNIRHSQNIESKIILENTDYRDVGKDALSITKSSVGRILAGQVIYYAAPPLVYEVRCILKDKKIQLDEALHKIGEAAKRICRYVISHLGETFKNLIFNSIKKFVKTFMDILINMVKETVKKMLKLAKSLLMSVVDAAKIIATPGTSVTQKGDAIFTLFGITLANFVVEVIFEIIEKGLQIPEFLLMPLQVLTSVVCTNLVMLILQKADVFDVRFGFKMKAIKELFENERTAYENEMNIVYNRVDVNEQQLIEKAKADCKEIYCELMEIKNNEDSVRESLQELDKMFAMNINFDGEWQKFICKYDFCKI